MRDIAIAVIEGYQTLIKTNREVVSTGCSKDIFYHPEFLKDIYRLVIDDWRLSSAVILANFTRSIKETLKQPVNFELSIRAHLVN